MGVIMKEQPPLYKQLETCNPLFIRPFFQSQEFLDVAQLIAGKEEDEIRSALEQSSTTDANMSSLASSLAKQLASPVAHKLSGKHPFICEKCGHHNNVPLTVPPATCRTLQSPTTTPPNTPPPPSQGVSRAAPLSCDDHVTSPADVTPPPPPAHGTSEVSFIQERIPNTPPPPQPELRLIALHCIATKLCSLTSMHS